jgi:hypothetical protein
MATVSSPVRGQSVHVEELVAALREAGHEVLVVGSGIYEKAGFGSGSRVVVWLRRVLPGAPQELAELAYNYSRLSPLGARQASFQPELIYERYNPYYLAGTWLAPRSGTNCFWKSTRRLSMSASVSAA